MFVQACEVALAGTSTGTNERGGRRGGKVRRPEGAWAKLSDVAKLLSVDESEFTGVLRAVFDGGSVGYTTLVEALGLSGMLGVEEAQNVLRARAETPRR